MTKKENTNIEEKVRNEVLNNILGNELIQNNDKIVVAVSGGPDSMCLLSVLYELKNIFCTKYSISYNMVVAHVNHGIRKESDQEKVYVENFCNDLNIPFYYLKENVEKIAKQKKMSVEACGRKIRYDFFYKVMKETKATKVSVAHNKNDNIETIFLNLIRGCGLKGLTGMEFAHNNIIRPLLTIEKKDILEYNIYKNLNPCMDITNTENIYLRNKIRNKLIPLINREYNSNFENNIIRMKEILSNDENFLKEYTDNILRSCIISDENSKILFNSKLIVESHIAIANRMIREIIKKRVGNLDLISNIHINDIYRLLKNDIKGKKYIITNRFTIKIVAKGVAVIY